MCQRIIFRSKSILERMEYEIAKQKIILHLFRREILMILERRIASTVQENVERSEKKDIVIVWDDMVPKNLNCLRIALYGGPNARSALPLFQCQE